MLLKDKQIKLSKGHRILSKKETRDRKYYKYHNMFRHITNNYVCFGEMIEKTIKQGRLKVVDKGKKVMIDKSPFLVGLNYIKPINKFTMDIKVMCYYEYDDPLDIPFFLKLIHWMEKPLLSFSKGLK